MRFQFSFKHMEASQTLTDYAERKIREKVERLVTKPIEAHVTFIIDKHMKTVRCSFIGGDGFNIFAEHTCDDMHASIDNVLDKLAGRFKKQKEKIKSHRSRTNVRHLPTSKSPGSARDGEEIDAEDILKYEAARRRRVAG